MSAPASLTLRVELGNAAFAPTPGPELARILRAVAGWIEDGSKARPILDVNGNTVGSWEIR